MTDEPDLAAEPAESPDAPTALDAGRTAPEVEEEIVLDDDRLRSALEAVLLVVDTPATTDELATAVDQDRARVRTMLTRMAEELTESGSGIDLRYAGDGWRLYTRAEFAPYVERLLLDGARSKLTRAALETLAVIAYRQPVTRARVSAIRGVNVDGVIRTLVARGLINEVGTDPQTSAITYATTELFLERLGLASLTELPDLAPLLPDVDVIDDLDEEISADPRFAKLGGHRSDSIENELPGTDAEDSPTPVRNPDDQD
ncbi:SMC-Scp complex subunit ScpB [Gordonia sp. SID5947]|uniref:SMC-Scp complex subunit ScpB n=1 Tax=Gordonia sp. SID5947 TaxID=2690315 RepID=UPI00137150D0|nr:SMC-Scp complex subunit ScpB [Gordonia sp. SID5947]MYR05376.1 SMC-Scp complex subunit ScpB [Gordonia sp. SID5947]